MIGQEHINTNQRKPPAASIALGPGRNGNTFTDSVEIEKISSVKTKVRILIIDDAELHMDWMTHIMMGKYGEKVKDIVFAKNFAKAMDKLKEHKFDLVITDTEDHECEIERAIGAKVIRMAKRANEECYVIGMSDLYVSKEIFIAMGADDFFDKQAGISQISTVLERFFGNGTGHQE